MACWLAHKVLQSHEFTSFYTHTHPELYSMQRLYMWWTSHINFTHKANVNKHHSFFFFFTYILYINRLFVCTVTRGILPAQKQENNHKHGHTKTRKGLWLLEAWTRPERQRIKSWAWIRRVHHSNSRSSSVSSVSMLDGSAIGPSFARRAAISSSVFSLSCFFFSWIFFSLAGNPFEQREVCFPWV